MITMQEALQAVLQQQDLSREQMTAVMRQIMTGEATPAQIGGFLVGLRMKGETVAEITAAASVMRELAAAVDVPKENLVDTCGTGGDGSGLFNVSTAVAFVAAAAGAKVAKHGNRSISSKSGSADLLEAAGVNLSLSPEQVAQCVTDIGVGFMFAPAHHSAMKHAIGPRKEMAVRTIFNVLGPLTNPAAAPNQVLGVFAQTLTEPLAQVLNALGSRHVMVVASDDGLDELSIAAPTQVSELKNGAVSTWTLNPADYGVQGELTDCVVDSAAASLALIQSAFAGEQNAAANMIALNAGAAIYVSGVADTLEEGIDKAKTVLANGAAAQKFAALIQLSQELAV